MATSPLYSFRLSCQPKTKLIIYKMKEWGGRRADCRSLVSPEPPAPFPCSLSPSPGPHPPSLKPRMQCLFKNALADEIFHCLACRGTGKPTYCPLRCPRSQLTYRQVKPWLFGARPPPSASRRKREGGLSVTVFCCCKRAISFHLSRFCDLSMSSGRRMCVIGMSVKSYIIYFDFALSSMKNTS